MRVIQFQLKDLVDVKVFPLPLKKTEETNKVQSDTISVERPQRLRNVVEGEDSHPILNALYSADSPGIERQRDSSSTRTSSQQLQL
jgi:hypothetical protein